MGLDMYAYAVKKRWHPAPIVKDLGYEEFYEWGANRFMLYLIQKIYKKKGGQACLSDEYVELKSEDMDFIEKAVLERSVDGKTANEIQGREYAYIVYDLEFVELARSYLAHGYRVYFRCSS